MDEQELTLKFQMFEQQIKQIQQQLQAVENGIIEMNTINDGLSELVGSKDKEILAPVGRGIFAKAKLLSEELTVDIGNKNFVKKSIPDTQKIIKEQVEKLKEVRDELNSELNKINAELTNAFMESQGNNQEGKGMTDMHI